MQPSGTQPAFAQELGAARRKRFVDSTRKVSLFKADVVEHPLGDGDVLWLSSVRRARERELIVLPAQLRMSPGFKEGHQLERLGA